MAEFCPGSVIFFALDRAGPVMSAHLAEGGKAAYVRENEIILAEGSAETVLMKVAEIPATHGGLIPFQVSNSLAAASACWGAGVPLDSIRLGLRTFQSDEKMTPGRFNMFNVGRARVIVDYGHNPHALRAVQAAVEQMKPRRAIGGVAAPGDRRDADIQELATVAAHTFDLIIVHEDYDLRGRERGEVAQLISETIARARPSLPLTTILNEAEAVQQALDMAQAGDLVVLFVDKVDETIEQVKNASLAIKMEESDSFYVPVSGATAVAQRTRLDARTQAAPGDGLEAATGNGHSADGAPITGGNGSRTNRKRAQRAPERITLPEASDGEVESSR
jgi:cyanophycin synthetase